MTVSGGEMEAPVAMKWPMAVWGGERREREGRERETLVRIRKKKKGVRILMYSVNIIDGKSIGNELMK